MKARAFRTTLLIAALSIAAVSLQAAPSLPITEPPITSTYLDGPPVDPGSTNGQWFIDLEGNEEYRPYEFHDNRLDFAGGAREVDAIYGYVIYGSLQYSTGAAGVYGDPIIGFKMEATVFNDTPSSIGDDSLSSNQHGESRPAGTDRYVGTLEDAKLSAEFAIADINTLPAVFAGPYLVPQYPSWIIADNEDQLGWYCWNPQETQGIGGAGDYYVPTWDFGDINIGQSVSRTLSFSIDPPMDSSDPRYGTIYASEQDGTDLFANRTTSLKISTWIESLAGDNWMPYPEEPLRGSDVSVFHNEEPPYDPTHKMHWPQLPDPNGWDVRACNGNYNPDDGLRKILADDFRCTSNGPITKITFWGSYKNDDYEDEQGDLFGGITNLHLSIHKDIPAGELAPWSMPQEPPEWQRDIDPANPPVGWIVEVVPEIPSLQGWYDPNTQEVEPENHWQYFRYEVTLPSDEAFVQTAGEIYWLDLAVETLWQTWGWKTSVSEHFMDDAVWTDRPVTNQMQWQELVDPITGESLDLAFVIDGGEPQEDEYDWGDAPDPLVGTGPGNYQTLAADNGAVHQIVQGAPYFDDVSMPQTDQPDGEPDGQPDPNALGDDMNGAKPDDEDGIIIPFLAAGQTATITITVDDGAAGSGAGGAYVDAWIDYNADGIWGPLEQIFSGWMIQGPNPMTVSVPASATLGQTFGRFRINSLAAGLPSVGVWPTGSMPDGEVEDHEVFIEEGQELDWGDAPDAAGAVGFNTLAGNSGANHAIIPNFMLGTLIDNEPNGQPTGLADGDDINGAVPYPPGDEEGVVFTSLIVPGLQATLQVTLTSTAQAYLDAWMDLDGSGTWTSGDQIFTSYVLNPGANILSFPVPNTAVPGTSYARFRLSTAGGLPATGYASDGEVEDYMVVIEDPIDWGDAPDGPYPTLSINGGASHIILGGGLNPTLGALVDPEPDGQPTPIADGDDLDAFYPSLGDDEDGVTFATPFIPGTVAQINVMASGPAGYLQCWVDANGNGLWTDPGEQVLTDVPLTPGNNSLTFVVPPNGTSGYVYAGIRFRYSSARGLTFTGPAQDGEVEDYMVDVYPNSDIDWGDSPTGYPTLAANNGAHHVIMSGMFLGNQVDSEPDGQPSINADGDDNDLLYPSLGDDEDGVFLTCATLMPGGYASVDVIASQPGVLDAWMDFNADGSWAQTGDQIFSGQPLSAGVNSLLFPVPLTAAWGPGYSRFRFTSGGVPSYTGLALDGEVEDYEFLISRLVSGTDFGDATNSYPTLLPTGARHTITAGVMLGATIDPEPDGQPSPAVLDDNVGLDDEDGVTFTSKIVAGSNATVNVVAGVSGGTLDAWIDFNADGSWSAGEKVLGLTVAPGLNNLSFTVPQPSALGPTFARFRISSAGTPLPSGSAADGEVEDYYVELYQPAPTNNIVITNQTFNASHAVSTNEWTVESGITYQMESSTNLVTGPWVPAGPSIIGPVNWQTNNMAAETSKFYRVIAPWTP
ncbi:GEVED domain-containing protein [Pontiella sulfatireligans]|uniref:Uncharacterized protein n=1 Tax=Pontiella sulfatireligans TaxID=2750658 RepID=A0A6C2UIL6_9BACT|nr:GEVED domain-containing protein [Pontiella sulfatireligans]VGO19297.1 hypothetical protein SCARR_01355 [Pontiella sulfatireligans]